MEVLGLRERKEWESVNHPRLLRTGCTDVWDAIFWSIREYRDADTPRRLELIRKYTRMDPQKRMSVERIKRVCEDILRDSQEEEDEENENEDRDMFFSLFSRRLLETELFPFMMEYIENESSDWTRIREEMMDKSNLLAEYRLKKLAKKTGGSTTIEEVAPMIKRYLGSRFDTEAGAVSYDTIWEACLMLDYHVLILSSEEKLLFDSYTWKEIPESDFRECIIILSHVEGGYESIGVYSFTKDNHQKISRLFGHDDELVMALRSS
jgi:hypothetical protein